MAYLFNTTTKREGLVDTTKVPQHTKEIVELVKLHGHQNVVDHVIPKKLEKFKVFSSKLWTMVVPNNFTKVPVLMAHTDIAGNGKVNSVSFTMDGKGICNTAHANIGGDDRLGCWIIKKLLEEGDDRFAYILFDQEEVGCIGSEDFAKSKSMTYIKKIATCFIGLDRKGSYDLALYGYESSEFMEVLGEVKDFRDDWGSYTDCSTLAGHSGICCVNFSVGYYHEHTKNEYIIPDEALNTLNTIKTLPASFWTKQYKADPTYQGYGLYGGYTGYEGYNEYTNNSGYTRNLYTTDRDITCACCQRVVDEYDVSYSIDGEPICASCISTNPDIANMEFDCAECGSIITPTEGKVNRYGELLCGVCYEAETLYGVDSYRPQEYETLVDEEHKETIKDLMVVIVDTLIGTDQKKQPTLYKKIMEDLKLLQKLIKKDVLTEVELQQLLYLEDTYA